MQEYTALTDVTAIPVHVLSQKISSTNAQAPIHLGRAVAFHRVFKDIAGSTNGGVFLSQLWYWTHTMYAKYGDKWDGWVFKTAEEWEEETGLTRAQQETIRKRLFDKGVLVWSNKGRVCGVIQFWLDVRVLFCLLAQIQEKAKADAEKSPRGSRKLPKQIRKNANAITESTKESSQQSTTTPQAPVVVSSPKGDVCEQSRLLSEELTAKGFRPSSKALQLATDWPEIVRAQLQAVKRRSHKVQIESAGKWLRTAIYAEIEAAQSNPEKVVARPFDNQRENETGIQNLPPRTPQKVVAVSNADNALQKRARAAATLLLSLKADKQQECRERAVRELPGLALDRYKRALNRGEPIATVDRLVWQGKLLDDVWREFPTLCQKELDRLGESLEIGPDELGEVPIPAGFVKTEEAPAVEEPKHLPYLPQGSGLAPLGDLLGGFVAQGAPEAT